MVTLGNIENAIVIVGNNNTINDISQKAIAASNHSMKSANVNFEGRERYIKSISALLLADKGVAICALNGMGGIGKSDLARVVAHHVKEHFPAGQIELDLTGMTNPKDPRDVLLTFMRVFEPEISSNTDFESLKAKFRTETSKKKLLIYYDNAKDAKHVAELLPSPPSVALITSRQTIALDNVKEMTLERMSEAEAVRLLGKLTDNRFTRDDYEALAKKAGYLPLALNVMGKFLNINVNFTVEQYLIDLVNPILRKKRLTLDASNQDVYAVLALSLTQLQATKPKLASLWMRLYLFPDSFDKKPLEGALWGDETDVQGCLSTLIQWHLLGFENERYILHDLLKDIAKEAAANVGDEFVKANEWNFAVYFYRHLGEAHNLYRQDNYQGLTLYDGEAENILKAYDITLYNKNKDHNWLRLLMDFPNSGVYILALRFTPQQRILWL